MDSGEDGLSEHFLMLGCLTPCSLKSAFHLLSSSRESEKASLSTTCPRNRARFFHSISFICHRSARVYCNNCLQAFEFNALLEMGPAILHYHGLALLPFVIFPATIVYPFHQRCSFLVRSLCQISLIYTSQI